MAAVADAHILVADRDPNALESSRGALTRSGYRVSVAGDRQILLQELKRAVPDLLVVDATMPGGDGIPMLQELKCDRRWRDIPVLIVSSHFTEQMPDRSVGPSAREYLRKPFRPQELIARVEAQLRLSAMLQATRRALRSAEEELQRAREDVSKSSAAANHRAQVIEATRADNARLEVLAHTDALTQLLNRRALTQRLEAEMERARRYDSGLTLLMLDLDHFKRINDTMGHLAGDDVLRELAALLRESVRTVDLVARFGGEEFVVVLPETGLPGAVRFAERTAEQIEARQFAVAHGGARLTSSIGVAAFPAPGVVSVDDLFSRADQALYRAKAAGRNMVCT